MRVHRTTSRRSRSHNVPVPEPRMGCPRLPQVSATHQHQRLSSEMLSRERASSATAGTYDGYSWKCTFYTGRIAVKTTEGAVDHAFAHRNARDIVTCEADVLDLIVAHGSQFIDRGCILAPVDVGPPPAV